MLTALVLTVSLASIPATPEGVHLSRVGESMSARLIAQAPAPLPVRPMETAPMGAREGQLQSEIDAINTQLRGLKADWPTAKAERDELIQRRGELERELKGLKQGGTPGVDRSFESSPRLFTVAAF